MMLTSNRHYTPQLGFTLVELMISIVLGLLISAAVIQIYLTNVRTTTTQKSGSELQDASIFGLQQLEAHIRLANLGNSVNKITDTTENGGIVLSLKNLGVTDTIILPFLTHTAGDKGFTSTSNINNINSDQLTIQFTNTTGQTMSDCESVDIPPNTKVIERYFVRQVTGDTSTGAVKNLALVCDAGRIDGATITDLSANYKTGGNELITGVDQFKVLLGVQDATNRIMYLPSSTYISLTTSPHPSIVAVRVGLIVRGSTPIVGSSDKTSFTLLGQTHELKTDTTRKQLVRTTYESTTLLRNARVISVTP
ncbi:pilus assembly protein PilW [Enhydrobacter sp. H5]|uniref:Pilus assembly protein PilW n=1 Tax=Enhydrobacter aerosaccus TaxID=225324 RepID=A0ABR5IJG6_9HYPH|nr:MULTISPECIES: PilW family protein [Pseudomonadota]KND18858.1 pilus assembly protein PilW [Enhydrobacter aerosaccus]ONG40950.1 pilus assembly protein PilW [Enhydrobacter sp. H5]